MVWSYLLCLVRKNLENSCCCMWSSSCNYYLNLWDNVLPVINFTAPVEIVTIELCWNWSSLCVSQLSMVFPMKDFDQVCILGHVFGIFQIVQGKHVWILSIFVGWMFCPIIHRQIHCLLHFCERLQYFLTSTYIFIRWNLVTFLYMLLTWS